MPHKTNPRRIPRTQADVDRAYGDGITDGLKRGIDLMLYVLIDKHDAPMEDLQQLAGELNHAAQCVAALRTDREWRVNSMSKLESLDVEFKASMSKADNCICNFCHGTGIVIKLIYPITMYHDRTHLSTKYREIWLCQKCRTKLSFALDWPDDTYERRGRKEGADHAT